MATWKRILTEGDVGPGTATDTSLATHDQILAGTRIINAASSSVLTIKGDDLAGGDNLSSFVAEFSAPAGNGSSTILLYGQVGIKPFQWGGNQGEQGYLKFFEHAPNGASGISVYAPQSLASDQGFALPASPADAGSGQFLTLESSSSTPYTSKWVWKKTPDLAEIVGGAGEPSGSVVGEADPDKYLMIVHDVDAQELKKMDIQELYGAITTSLFQALIDAGYGSTEAYTGTSGLLGDINGDGSVSAADLLEFLTQFGAIETAEPLTIDFIDTVLMGTAQLDGVDQSGVLIDIGTGDTTVDNGAFSVTVDLGTDEWTITEGINNALLQYPNKTVTIEPIASPTNGSGVRFGTSTPVYDNVKLYLEVTAFNENNNYMSDSEYLIHEWTTPGVPGAYNYVFPLVSISGDVLGINGPNTAESPGVATLKFAFRLEASYGYISTASIAGVRFTLTVT